MQTNILLSFRRSGNTWLRYIVSMTSDMMCVDSHLTKSIQQVLTGNPKFLLTDASVFEKVLYKTHHLNEIQSQLNASINNVEDLEIGRTWLEDETRDRWGGWGSATRRHPILNSFINNEAKLVFILRDYFETYCREIPSIEAGQLLAAIGANVVVKEYSQLLIEYDEYQGPKVLIRYEDLMTNPKKCVTKVLNFLNVFDQSRVEDFFNKLDEHKNISLNMYTATMRNPSNTKGNRDKLKHYQNELFNTIGQLPILELHKEIKSMIIKHMGEERFNKYLAFYEQEFDFSSTEWSEHD